MRPIFCLITAFDDCNHSASCSPHIMGDELGPPRCRSPWGQLLYALFRFWRAAARYGFIERPDIPALLQRAHRLGCAIDLSDITYYVGHQTVVHDEDGKALPRLAE